MPGTKHAAIKPTFFASAAELRRWFKKNHAKETELWIGYYKKGTGKKSVTYPESVDEALCVGWIDGVRKSIDDESYMNRFTPRRQGSHWSAVNLRRVRELTEEGRMLPAGLKAHEARDPKKAGLYSFEQRSAITFGRQELSEFKASIEAWRFFQQQPPGYRKLATFWVMSAKREATRQRRLAALIADSAGGRRLDALRPGEKEKK
jgi:uncharacterized protein YdeI (YjbR/CyaY-like superfamily)